MLYLLFRVAFYTIYDIDIRFHEGKRVEKRQNRATIFENSG